MQSLKGKTVFVSGASSGIGKSCAEAFARAGAKLILCARSAEPIKELSVSLKELHQVESLPLRLDVSDRAAVNAAIEALPDAWKKIDILINNAGGALGLEKLHEGNPDDWDAIRDQTTPASIYSGRRRCPR